eukprot:scaffold91667_cov63-Phaeocystis_antarctica.AAC.2
MLSRVASSGSAAPGSPLSAAATSETAAGALSGRRSHPAAAVGLEGTSSRKKGIIGGPAPGPLSPFVHGVEYAGSERGGVFGGVFGSSSDEIAGGGSETGIWLIMRRKSGTEGSEVGMSASAFISIAIEARRVGSPIGGARATSRATTGAQGAHTASSPGRAALRAIHLFVVVLHDAVRRGLRLECLVAQAGVLVHGRQPLGVPLAGVLSHAVGGDVAFLAVSEAALVACARGGSDLERGPLHWFFLSEWPICYMLGHFDETQAIVSTSGDELRHLERFSRSVGRIWGHLVAKF